MYVHWISCSHHVTPLYCIMFCCLSSNGDSSCVVNGTLLDARTWVAWIKENVSMKTMKMNMWQWVRKEADIEITIWDGLRLLWLVLLEFTASDQLRGLANWSNKFTSRDIRYLTSTALRFKLCLQICLHIINCCCCHLLVLSTWISSFPVCRHGSRTLSSHDQLRTGFHPSVPHLPYKYELICAERRAAELYLYFPSSEWNADYGFTAKLLSRKLALSTCGYQSLSFSPKNIKMPTK